MYIPIPQENRGLWILLCALLLAIFLIGGYLMYVSYAGIPVSGADDQQEQAVVLRGVYSCLPHADGTKPKECTPGIKTDSGEYTALDMGLVIESGGNIKLTDGTRILAGGVVVPIEEISSDQWKPYPIKGIMRVEEIAKQ